MGLADRDYMHERRDGDNKVLHFRPVPKKTSVVTIVLYLVVTFYLLYRATLWWQGNQLQKRMPAFPTAEIQAEVPPTAEPTRTFAPQIPRAAQAEPNQPPAPGTVSKCVVNGKVTYSDAACPKEAIAGSVKLIPTDPGTVSQKSMAVSSPPVVSQQSDAASEPQPTIHAPTQAAPAKTAECRNLDEVVKQVDKQALQPLTLQQQDLLRVGRKKARDRQFFLGC